MSPHRVNRRLAIGLLLILATLVGPLAAAQSPGEKRIDINTASSEQLQTLPGIGPAVAGRIIDYREKFGPFENKAELMNVKGIGEKTYASLKDRITVGQVDAP